MKTIHVLTTNDTPNSLAFNLPLRRHRKLLRAFGIEVKLFLNLKRKIFDCDAFFINSKFLKSLGRQQHIEFLLKAKEQSENVLWFDTTDGTGATQFEVLPYVDGYYKSQILRDKQHYLNEYYGSRIYTDYYHKKYGILDEASYQSLPASAEGLPKIQVSWNSALGNWGESFFGKISKYLSIPFPYRYLVSFVDPAKERTLDITCRIGRTYNRNTIRYQRDMIAQLLETTYGVETSKIPKKAYFQELHNAKIGVSPFGWGEIAYRDFEIIINGAALFKPDMSHLQTWPSLYVNGNTYIAHSWDMSDIGEKLDELLSGNKYVEIAQNAQRVYQKYLFEPEGHEAFCERVVSIVKRHT